jgi:hypothetical protein
MKKTNTALKLIETSEETPVSKERISKFERKLKLQPEYQQLSVSPFPVISLAGVLEKEGDFFLICRVLNQNGSLVEYPIQCDDQIYMMAQHTLALIENVSGLSTLSPQMMGLVH